MVGAGVAGGTGPGDGKQSSHQASSPSQGRTNPATTQGGDGTRAAAAQACRDLTTHCDRSAHFISALCS